MDRPATTEEARTDAISAAHEAELAAILTTDPGQRRPTLRHNPILAQAARERAVDMARYCYLSHVNRNGEGPNTLVARAGYTLYAMNDRSRSGNNIESAGADYGSARAVWRRWMGSLPHRTHLLALNPQFREQSEYGIGYARARSRGRICTRWVVLIAQPATDTAIATR